MRRKSALLLVYNQHFFCLVKNEVLLCWRRMAYCTEMCLLPLPSPPQIVRCKRQTVIQHDVVH